jgi:hypothetical protein
MPISRVRQSTTNLAQLGNNLPTLRGEVTSMDIAALAFGNGSKTAVETPA